MFNQQLKQIHSIQNKELARSIAITFVIDLIGGAIAAGFAYLLLGTVIPEIINGLHAEVGNSGLTITLFSVTIDPVWFKRVFSWKNCFAVLFGLRFIISYLVGAYGRSIGSSNKI